MERNVLSRAAEFIKAQRRKKRWTKAVSAMAAVVVFCTTYALILPAITLQAECGKEEHTHSDACYTVETVTPQPTMLCSMEALREAGLHEHDGGCYDDEDQLICGFADFVVHAHDKTCYDLDGKLICTLEEIEEHQHDRDCYTREKTLVCQEPESDGHRHDDGCYEQVRGDLICTSEEEDHEHSDDCYAWSRELVCDQEETQGHSHSGDCYETEWVLDCDKPEIELHEHDEDCYDDGVLTCGRIQVTEHVHGDDCIQPPEGEPYEVRTLTCGKEEHEHAEACYLTEPTVEEPVHEEPETSDFPALTEDNALVCELQTAISTAESQEDAAQVYPMTVCNQEDITYCVSVKTQAYTDEIYGEGRVKLEFVLPLSAEEAAFNLSAMSWLDRSDGYAPEVTTQPRIIGEDEVPCQVLTGYKLLSSQKNEGVVPGEFTEELVVSVLDMEPGETVAVQISAAMEHNAWAGSCETHQQEERLTVVTDPYTVVEDLSSEEQQAIYKGFLAEIEELEALRDLDEDGYVATEELLQRIREAYQQGQLSEEAYTELCGRVSELTTGDIEIVAEAAEGTNWMLLRDSGWFEAYSSYAGGSGSASTARLTSPLRIASTYPADGGDSATSSNVQIKNQGGTNTSADGAVSVSKTISGTDLENVFDITLQVQTSMNVAEIREEPDMAVVIVMDISNTMNSNFGGVTRYAAAMTAAEQFLDQFAANNSLGISRVGYVAFNTDAHQIFGLQSCSTAEQANALKNTMRTQTGSIINANGYADSHTRFTNVEAGLAMASDMLNGVSNKNKYIIFLSDGFPTTYISSGYSGYDPYDSTGRFYDHVLKKPCLYGTSYSDEAAIRARNKAAAIKASGTTIFSIGVDVAGQTIQTYITQSEKASGHSVVDRTGTTYEIGDASSTEAYKSWLRNSIGSGYYYESTDSAGLNSAYNQIFAEIKHQIAAGTEADWVASDPLPTVNGSTETVEFIGFYNMDAVLISDDLTGTHTAGGENTAAFTNPAISWDLKNSGYQETTSDGKTTYTYQLVYRVRLKNEISGFTEGTIYPTNDTTTLQYRTVEGTDGNLTVSEPKKVDFPIPSVQGYLADLTFTKVDSRGQPLAGAEFTLKHDPGCSICRGDRTSVEVPDKTATSDGNGKVSFINIPSGHKYTLTETKIPDGYSTNGYRYAVVVAYDQVTVTVTAADGTPRDWTGEIVNNAYYALPETGGAGTMGYTFGGLLLMAGAGYLLYKKTRDGREAR